MVNDNRGHQQEPAASWSHPRHQDRLCHPDCSAVWSTSLHQDWFPNPAGPELGESWGDPNGSMRLSSWVGDGWDQNWFSTPTCPDLGESWGDPGVACWHTNPWDPKWFSSPIHPAHTSSPNQQHGSSQKNQVELLMLENDRLRTESQKVNASIVRLWCEMPDVDATDSRESLRLLDSCAKAVQVCRVKQVANQAAAQQALAEKEELKKIVEEARLTTKDLEEQLNAAQMRLQAIKKDLSELCCCPLSFQPMREPVLATDLFTYEKDVIERALDNKPASPFTRAHMVKGLLRPNKLAASLLHTMTDHFPDWEDGTIVKPQLRPAPVGIELLLALESRRSDEAIELLGRDVDLEYLNQYYSFDSMKVNLLQLSICLHLPEVAVAIVKRPDFKRMESFSNQGLLAIHMAAAYDYADVCGAIVDDMGDYCLTVRTSRRTQLRNFQGLHVTIPGNSTAADCARLFGHTLRVEVAEA